MSASEDDSMSRHHQTSDLALANDDANDFNHSCIHVNKNRCNTTLLDNTPEYLAQLLSDKKKLQNFSGLFVHLEKLLDEEIGKVRKNLFHLVPDMLNSQRLPEPLGAMVTLSERLTVPVNDYPDYNFVGRILGPRGRTAKQLEQDMDCKIMIRGKGSTRNASKDPGKQKQNQEHMAEELHVLVTVEDAENRAKTKLDMAVEQVKKLLVPAPEGEDSLKRKQLMELAIINGTYRETKSLSSSLSPVSSSSPSNTPQIINNSQIFGRAQMALQRPQQTGLLSPTLANGAPIILTSARLPHVPLQTSPGGGLLEGHSLINPAFINALEPQGGILVQIDSNGLLQPAFIDLGYSIEASQAGPLRRSRVCMRDQPYLR